MTLDPLDLDTGTAKFDLTLSAIETAEGLRVRVEYNTDLFAAPTIARLTTHYRTLLEGVVADPDRPISTLPLLTDAERHQMLIEWNDTRTDYPRDRCIHELFAEQAARTPDAVAVVYEGDKLTYRELDGRANQLAHYLQRLGVGPDVLVGLCVERSLEMVVGLLGILKAGGAYVPLDPTYPRERLAFMLEDAQVVVLLTQQRLRDHLPPHTTRVVLLDVDWPLIATETAQTPTSAATGASAAYVIYTSGSTGAPKGALIPHGNIVRLFAATHSWFHFDARDVWTLFHSFAFDFSVWEMWGALLHGGRLVVVPFITSSTVVICAGRRTLLPYKARTMCQEKGLSNATASCRARPTGQHARRSVSGLVREPAAVRPLRALSHRLDGVGQQEHGQHRALPAGKRR